MRKLSYPCFALCILLVLSCATNSGQSGNNENLTDKSTFNAIAFSPNGAFVFTAGNIGIKKWSLRDKTFSWFTQVGVYNSLAVSPQGDALFAGGVGIFRWDVNTGKSDYYYNTPDSVSALAFSGDGKFLYSAGAGVLEWDIDAELGKLISQDSKMYQMVSVASNAKIVYAYEPNFGVVRIDLTKKKIELVAADPSVTAIVSSSDGSAVYVAGFGFTKYDFSSKTATQTVIANSSGYNALTLSPDEKFAYLAPNYGIQKINIETKSVEWLTRDGQYNLLVFSPDGKSLYSAGIGIQKWLVSN